MSIERMKKAFAGSFGQAEGGGLFQTAADVFAATDIAEEVIAEMQAEMPEYASTIDDCFQYLMPSVYIRQFQRSERIFESIYRAHCREMIMRVIEGKPLKPATKPEMLHFWMQSTWLGGPLQRRGARAYWECFKAGMPQDIIDQISMDRLSAKDLTFGAEEYAGATLEIHIDIAKKMAIDRGGKPSKNKPAEPDKPKELKQVQLW